MRCWIIVLSAVLAACAASLAHADSMKGEDGYDLWLRYRPLATQDAANYAPHMVGVVAIGDSPTLTKAQSELQTGLSGLLGRPVFLSGEIGTGAVIIGTLDHVSPWAKVDVDPARLGDEGFVIRTIAGKHPVTVIAGNTDRGVLYGVFRYLRLVQTRQSVDNLDIVDAPKVKIRSIDHWDNIDGSVERGYAGRSIFDWWKLPDVTPQRYTDYARAEASIGINGVVVNNVNAKADSLTAPYIAKAAALANIFRPYGIKLYLSARFSAPIEIGGLKTADPEDPAVQAFWKAKADEIYTAIPDFGGFLVKANSEGQPGPADYHRTHAEGANMLARAVAPHGGIVMWRAFVYASENPEDRFKQAYDEFHPLDGQFDANVLVQIKNGPIDFQPREPFSPLFGAMLKSNEMLELEITKEYTGQATHVVYLGPLYEEVLKADTYLPAKGATVARIIDGAAQGQQLTGIAGVANTGSDRNWSGSDFDQANWYAFGRLAWDPEASARDIADDWARMTFSNDPGFVKPVVEMMMSSRETMVDYMTPLGLAHQMGTDHHYGPAPWVHELKRPEWNPVYYAKALPDGIGFDRTRTGSDALSQYAPQVAAQWSKPHQMDERYLLWFHHEPWSFKMKDGQTLWNELAMKHQDGVDQVDAMQKTWAAMQPYVDPERFEAVSQDLAVQAREARWWRDACMLYYQSQSGLPLPAGYPAPAHDLAWYEAQSFPYAPGQAH